MPGFELEQVDGGSPIDLPYGETVLGRGPFLGVNDKRVSRNHGVLENQSGQLRLKPTHLNPCFIQTSIVAPPQPLEKDQWHFLKEGDIFSLMPGKYVYRVHVKEDAQTLRNSQAFEEEMEVEKCSPEFAEATLEAGSCTPSTPRLTHTLTADSTHTGCALDEVQTKPRQDEPALPQKKRVLPAWMMKSSAATSPSPAKVLKGTPVKPKRVATSKQATGPKRARASQLSSEEEEREEETQKRRAKRLRRDSEDETAGQTSLDDAAAPSSSAVGSGRMLKMEEREDEERRGGGRAGDPADESKAQTQESSDSQSGQKSETTESQSKTSSSKTHKKHRREPCAYGGSCYRRNPLHFQMSSHPGDSDYEEEKEEEDDERPECPYGTLCYRKNLLHKKEYKHTKSPPKANAEDEDEDEDRYENSFINDESEEEVDEDSDYVPESEDKEDMNRLQKEAKAFLRRRKW